jgi:hypothetical protein
MKILKEDHPGGRSIVIDGGEKSAGQSYFINDLRHGLVTRGALFELTDPREDCGRSI